MRLSIPVSQGHWVLDSLFGDNNRVTRPPTGSSERYLLVDLGWGTTLQISEEEWRTLVTKVSVV